MRREQPFELPENEELQLFLESFKQNPTDVLESTPKTRFYTIDSHELGLNDNKFTSQSMARRFIELYMNPSNLSSQSDSQESQLGITYATRVALVKDASTQSLLGSVTYYEDQLSRGKALWLPQHTIALYGKTREQEMLSMSLTHYLPREKKTIGSITMYGIRLGMQKDFFIGYPGINERFQKEAAEALGVH